MKYKYLLAQAADGGLWLKVPGEGRARPVCGVADACRALGRTRRQVYRHVHEGVLPARAKMLGEWLLDREAVARLARDPLAAWPVPERLKPLFPEYAVSDLNAGRDRVLIASRVLELGGERDVSWLLKRYGRSAIARFLREDGARLLSPRSLRLWSLCFKARPQAPPSWRTQANPWTARGGA